MGYQVYISEESEQSIQRITQINGYGYHLNSVYICCASMMVERMLDLSFPPEMCAQFALRCGVTEETDFLLLAGAIAGRFSLHHAICNEEEAFARVNDGAKAVLEFTLSAEGRRRYYLLDHIRKNQLYIINPSYQQGKGIPRSKKRLIETKDEYSIVPKDVYGTFYPENGKYYVFSA